MTRSPSSPAPEVLPWPDGVPRPLSAPPLTAARSDGARVARWIEKHCRYGEGDKFGQPVKLEIFQRIFLHWLFELRPDGTRRYRRALLEVPKGNGKTPIASWVAAYLLATQRSAVIPVAAASYAQAELLFGDLRTTIAESPTLRHLFHAFEGEVQVVDGPGRAYKIAAVAGTNDGQRPSAAFFDEIHEWTGGKARVHLVIANGAAKRAGSVVVNTTTPGADLDSMAGRLHEYGLKVNGGEIDDPEFLFVCWGCPEDRYDLDDHDQLLQAIRDANPAADQFLNVADVAARYYQIPRHEFARYHLGVWTSVAERWLPTGAWEACERPGPIPDGAEVVLGFDGSYNGDSTALTVVSCPTDDGELPHVDVVEAWERPDTVVGDWQVPILDVEAAIRAACKRWQVREIVCDPYRWARTYQILESEGLPIVEYPQSPARMIPATQRFYEAVTQGQLIQSGDPRLARHIANCAIKTDARGTRLTKEHRHSTRRIDLAVSAVMALDRACQPPELPPPPPQFYSWADL
ncbi:terminase TerL endonuclease subunit [Kitasatospora sp. NPDC004669]|uniref:terminase TerL endonuclease subunit n=1 Tax=Kitasatospora sp. NPDC004669 TaxID=3154555 RepID=UPI0033B6780E